MALKDWTKRNLSDFEVRNYVVYKWVNNKDRFKQIIISKSPYDDIDVLTPTEMINVYPQTISRAVIVAKSYMKTH
jgi:hypothetical protein